jgi:ferredoxin-NADP reductase
MSSMHGRDALQWLVPDVVYHDVFVCGPAEWMDAVMESLVAAGVGASQIHREEFAW